MPCDDVDDAALAEVAERDLRPRGPPRGAEHPRHLLVHPGVAGREHSVERGPAPPKHDLDPHLEHDADASEEGDRDPLDVPALDPRVG